jgi:hypothetical protein
MDWPVEFRKNAGGSLASGPTGYWRPLDDWKANPSCVGDDIRVGFEEGLRSSGWRPDDPLIANWRRR